MSIYRKKLRGVKESTSTLFEKGGKGAHNVGGYVQWNKLPAETVLKESRNDATIAIVNMHLK